MSQDEDCVALDSAWDEECMDVWYPIGVYLLGASSGALLTRIARQGLGVRGDNASAAELRSRRKWNKPQANTMGAYAGRSVRQLWGVGTNR